MALGCYVAPYFPASYKGVPFDAMEVTSEHGRRGAEGEFPFGESTAYADLGRRIRTYTIRGRFATNDHVFRSSLLIAACESPGPGLLLHPTRGIVIAACRSLKVTDDPLEAQGVTFIDLDFVEANLWGNGFALGTLLQAGLSLVALITALDDQFQNKYRPSVARIYNRPTIRDAASEAITDIRDEFSGVAVKATDTEENTWAALDELNRKAQDPSVLNSATNTFKTIRLGTAAIAARSSGTIKYEAFRRLANANAKTSSLDKLADQDSENAVYALMRTLSAGYMALASLETSTVSAGDVADQLEQISSILESEINAARVACDNKLFLELRQFYTAVQTSLFQLIHSLPPLVIYDFGGHVHSLVAAYEIYSDAKRSRELEIQNPSSWPWLLGPRVVASR